MNFGDMFVLPRTPSLIHTAAKSRMRPTIFELILEQVWPDSFPWFLMMTGLSRWK